ncbi:MAG: hydrogen gas-evolving membrane-bound hydrogenase subunit E [Thermomicrobium sp.]
MIASLALLCLLTASTPWLAPSLQRRFGYLAATVSLTVFAWFFTQLPQVTQGSVRREEIPWLPTLGNTFALQLDGLALVFALLITGIGTLVALYTVGYLEDHPRLGHFWTALLLFETSMLGLVLADDIIVFFVFWELTSISSFFLIGFAEERPRARANAQQALIVTGAGGLALLVGLLLLAQERGSFSLRELLAPDSFPATNTIGTTAFLLILLGAATKSAQFPFHFWLPNAMEAPTPVSAYLHSATMVKAGVYLLARVAPLFSVHPWWQPTLLALGVTTALVGALLAIPQRDLKRLLAYSTVSALGTLVFLLGLGTAGHKAFSLFLVAHALYKGGAFLVAGAIEHSTGYRTLEALGGLWNKTPAIALVTALVVLAAAGIPPTLGFVAKETIVELGLETMPLGFFVLLILAVIGQTTVAWLLLRPFLGRPPIQLHLHATHWSLLIAPLLLGLLALGSGMVLPLLQPLVSATVATIQGLTPTPVKLVLWHGFTPAFALSLVILAGAGVFALIWPRLAQVGDRLAVTQPLTEQPQGLARFGSERVYRGLMTALMSFAALQTRLLQNGYLRVYVTTIIATALLLVTAGLIRSGLRWAITPPTWTPVDVVDGILVVIILVSSMVAVRATERLAAVAALGALGFSLALLYARYGAPDLAITQVLVDTLTVVLLVFAFYRLPRYARLSSTSARIRDAFVATAFGIMMGLFALVVHLFRYSERISTFFTEQAYPAAHGRNVVNVILVDFRALDTLGEITVLGLAALGVAALLAVGKGTRRP